MAKKLTQREQARKQRDEELEKLAVQAKDLHEKAAKSEKSTLALGRILVRVRDYNPHGGLTLWIRQNIGKSVSTLNRCKYAISLADPKSKRNNGDNKKKPANRVHREKLEIIRASASTLLTSADKGNIKGATAAHNKIITTIEELMRQTAENAFKKPRRVHLEKIVADGKRLQPFEAAELASLPEVTDEEKRSLTRPWKVSAAVAGADSAGGSPINRTAEPEMFTKEEPPDRGMDEWIGMPEYVSDNLKPFQTVKVHFEKVEHRIAFANLISQTLTDKTKYVWYPETKEMSTAQLRYVDEEGKNGADKLREGEDGEIEATNL